MSARVLLDPAPPQDVPFPEHLSSLPTTGTEEFYATCLSRGLDYGPAFRSVRTLHLGQEEALAELVLPKDCPPVEGPHLVHPALWDGALQACIPLFPAEGPVLPISIDRVDTHSAPDSPLTTVHSHAVRVGDRAQLRLYDDRYRLVMTVHGLTMRVLEEPEHAASDIADGTHVFAFTPAPRPPRGNTATTWAVCHSGNAGKRAEALVEALQAAGSSGIVLEARAEHAGKTREWAQLLTSVPDPDGLVLLTADADSGLPAQRKGLNEAAALVRACTDLPSPPRLALATVGAQSPAPSSGPCDPGAALYWGFGRVLGSEHPELRTTLIDVDDDPSWAHMCAEELLTAEPHDQVALRGEDRYIGSVVSGDVEHATAPQHPTQPATGQGFRVLTARPGLWEGVEHRPSERWALAPEEVEVKMAAVSLNFIDVMRTMGIYPDPSGDPRSLGLDGAGTVTRVGAKVSGIVPGERVALYSNGGSLASHRTVPSFAVQPLPSGWSESEAATLPAVAITAWAALHDLAHVREGETVLIHSATGGLGLAAIQIARLLGGKVIATAGNPRKRRHLFDLGVEHVFDSRDLSWADRVLEVTQGRGVDVVLNSLTGAAIPLGLKVLADGGHFVEVGKKDIYSGRPLGLNTFKKGLTVSSFDLARVRERRPEYFARLFSEVWQQVEDGRLLPLPSIERPFSAAAEALREMSHGEHIGKFVITTPESVDSLTPEPLREGRFRGDGTYLISGGLGALGLSLAEFMVERGAGGVALLGRSDPGPEANERLATLREVGAKVTVLRADVSDADALRRARSQLPPLRGVVHAAGLLDDATVSTLSAEQLERVLAPKVDGAVNLDAATTDDPLDFFVLFSSAAGLLGNAGQAAYAAANTFLDAFATRRRQEGRPALSLQWGPFEDVGLAAAEDLRGRRLDARGMLSFPVARAWQVLEDLLQRDAPVVSYAPIDHRLYLESHPEKAHVASFRGWHENASGSGGASSPLSERLHRAEAVDRPALLESEIRSLAGRVLGLAEEAVEPDTPFKALGLDSLMGLELRNRLEAATGVRLSPTLLWTYGTARALAEALAEQLSETADQGQE